LRDRRGIGHAVTGKHRFLCEMAGRLEGEAVLDLGCGIGWFEDYAGRQGCARVVGMDNDEVRLELARRRAPEAVFISGDATVIDEDIGTFTLVAMFDFLEHLPRHSVPNVLRNVANLLEPGGRLLISVPYKGLLSTTLDTTYYLGHRHYRPLEIQALLDDAGFEISRVQYGGGIWEHISMIWLYIFKWVFGREMPFSAFLEKKRLGEYQSPSSIPGSASATLFVEAVGKDGKEEHE
jgi:SAM-dependent methyltransferase